MGHLGNPTAFRLGVQKNWTFLFFVKNLHYSELFHGLIHVKDFIHYYFSTKIRFFIQSIIFFSHLNILKKLKKIFIQIYIYCADLERISLNIINDLYAYYYAGYNKVKASFHKDYNKIKAWRELNNSDLGVFYLSFIFFYQGYIWKLKKLKKKKEPKPKTLREKEEAARYFFYKLALSKMTFKDKKEKNIDTKKEEQEKQLREKYNKILKSQRQPFTYKFFKFLLSIIKLKWNGRTETNKLKKDYKKNFYTEKKFNSKFKDWRRRWIAYCAKRKLSRKKSLLYFLFTTKFTKFNLRDIYNDKGYSKLDADKGYSKLFDDKIKTKTKAKTIKLNIFLLLLLLGQKVMQKKVKNSKLVCVKWTKILAYIKFFYKANLVNLKDGGMTHIYSFFYLMRLFIHFSYESKNKKTTKLFNLRDTIYRIIYYSVFRSHIYPIFVIITKYFKLIFTLFLNKKFDKDTISIAYYMITNNTVTSQLIASYIALKLSRNVYIKKILTPLKFELARVSRDTRAKYNYTKMRRVTNRLYIDRSNFLRLWLKKYIKRFYYLVKVFSFKYYKGINTFIDLNFFRYRLNNTRKLKLEYKKEKVFYKIYKMYKKVLSLLKKIFDNIRNAVKVKILLNNLLYRWDSYKTYKPIKWVKRKVDKDKVAKNNKNKKEDFYVLIVKRRNGYRLKKRFSYKLNLMYPMLLNLNNSNWKSNIKNEKSYYNNLFYYALQTTSNIYFYQTYKLISTNLIYIGSFFIKNLLNFKLVQDLWLYFKKFNLRNLRQKYIAKYRTSLYGFKIIVKGRFSRKQRVSKVSLNVGKVPLNTVDAKIDYTFFTLPITNSAVSVKVYLYKNANFPQIHKLMMQF